MANSSTVVPATLEGQAKGPFLNPLERANTATQQVADKVRGADDATLFKQVYGQDIFVYSDAVYGSIAGAIAAVDRTRAFNNFTSKYDAYLAGKAQHGKHLSTKDRGLRRSRLGGRQAQGADAAQHRLDCPTCTAAISGP